MGFFSSRTPEQKEANREAVRKLAKAQDELERVSKRDRRHPDDAAWNEANDAVWAARAAVPWWRR